MELGLVTCCQKVEVEVEPAAVAADIGIGREFEEQMEKVQDYTEKECCSYPYCQLFGESTVVAAVVAAAAVEVEIEIES